MKQTKIVWPELPYREWGDTLATLHQWIQIVGKIRLKAMPFQNHSWHTTLYITPRGFSTHAIPYKDTTFQIDFDFLEHQLTIEAGQRGVHTFQLEPMTVADFYQQIFRGLATLGIDVAIYPMPNELQDATPFPQNTKDRAYDKDAVSALLAAFQSAKRVFHVFRSDYLGKVSPVHLFWGAFDLAVSRFSGDAAPPHKGGMPHMPLRVMQEAYSCEVSSAGFWPGNAEFPEPLFYSYVYPTPEAFTTARVAPPEAVFNKDLGEFVLMYDVVRNSDDPDALLLSFLESTYVAAAEAGKWDTDPLTVTDYMRWDRS